MSSLGFIRARLLLAPLEPVKDLSKFRLRATCAAIALCHPLFLWIWTVWFPQPYESAFLRTAVSLIAILTLVLSYSRDVTDRIVESLYVVTVLTGTALIATWMYLGNQGNAVWTASFCVMLMLHFTLTDWRFALAGTAASFAICLTVFPIAEPVIWQEIKASSFIGPPLVVLGFTIAAAFFSHFADNNVRMVQLQTQTRALAIAAHEVRTPLAGIELVSGALAARLTELQPGRPLKNIELDELRGLSSNLMQCIHSTQAIIGTQLANANPFNPFSHRTPVHMLAVLEQAVKQFALSDAARADMVQIYAPVDFCFSGDAITMRQVVGNLLENAYTAVVRKSNHVFPGAILITLTIRQNTGELIVSDTGIGIKKEDLSKVFRPFHTTSEGSGHGLGLTFVQSVVRAYGGAIKIDSIVNKGSTFTLRFPLLHPR